MYFRWLCGVFLDFMFCASASCAVLIFCVFGKSVPCIDSVVFLYLCILAFVLWFLYFRSSARISVMCQCAHLDTVLPPSSSTFPLSIQIVHNNIICTNMFIPTLFQYHMFMSISCLFLLKCDQAEKHSSQSKQPEEKVWHEERAENARKWSLP